MRYSWVNLSLQACTLNFLNHFTGFPIVHGRVNILRVPKWSDSSCKTVVFPPYRFYPNIQVQVQITLNHMSLNDSVTVHHAITSWTESINTRNFTVCAMQSGRNGNNFNPFATIDWMAYQGVTARRNDGKYQDTKMVVRNELCRCDISKGRLPL